MKNIITNIDSRSPLAESIKTLRTNLQFMRKNKGLQSILITSTLPSEGKSWVSSNLAVAFAQAGKKTILIDSDMRKGTAHFIFDLPLTPGLSNYLSGVNMSDNYHITSVIQETEVENLKVITAGDIPPNPSELIMSDKMKELFDELEQVADVVIFDGTPSVLVTDAIILSRMVSSTVIIAEYNKTKMNNLKQVKEDIEKVGGKIAGVVLNKIPVKGSKYGYGYGQYGYGTYGYSSYGYTSTLPTVLKKNPLKIFFQKIKDFFLKIAQVTKKSIKKFSESLKKKRIEYNEKQEEKAKIKEEQRIEREKEAERLRIEREKEAERLRIEREKEAEILKIEKEKEAERKRIEKEKAEKERQEREKAEKERKEKEKAEKLRLEIEKAEKIRLEKEKAEKERLEREKAEKERKEKEAERKRIEKEQEEEVLHAEDNVLEGDKHDRYTHTYFTRYR